MTTLRRSERLRSRPKTSEVSLAEDRRPGSTREIRRSHDVATTNAPRAKPKRLRLTEKNLQKHSESLMGMGRTRKSLLSTSSVTTTDKQFGKRLTDNGVVYEYDETCAPKDEADLVATLLDESQSGPKPTHKDWERMVLFRKYSGGGELSLESMIVESMLTAHNSIAPSTYSRFRNEQWTEVESEITAGISDPKPDVMETYYWHAYPSQTIEDFAELVISQYGHAMPTFAVESKGPTGDHDQAVRQAAYDGAVMTHAALAVDGFLEKGPDVLFKTTKAITVTISTTHVHVYANHAVKEESPRAKIVYHQYELLEVKYAASEAEWIRAHTVLFNAQRLGLRLATQRLRDLENYYEAKELKRRQVEVEKTEKKAGVLVQTSQVMGPPPPKQHRQGKLQRAHIKQVGVKQTSVKQPDAGRDTSQNPSDFAHSIKTNTSAGEITPDTF